MIGVKLLTFDAAVLMLKLKLEAARNKSNKKDLRLIDLIIMFLTLDGLNFQHAE